MRAVFYVVLGATATTLLLFGGLAISSSTSLRHLPGSHGMAMGPDHHRLLSPAPERVHSNGTLILDRKLWGQLGDTCASLIYVDAARAATWQQRSRQNPSGWNNGIPLPDGCWPVSKEDGPAFVAEGGASTTAPFLRDGRGLLAAGFAAWAQEIPLIIRPDDVWILLLQQVAVHVYLHPEAYRGVLVPHKEGKKKLALWFDQVPSGDELVSGFVSLLQGNMNPGVVHTLLPHFTTTTAVDTVVQGVLLMDVGKSYFSYAVGITCGLPVVTLEGTQADWELLLQHWTALTKLFSIPATASADAGPASTAAAPWFQRVSQVLRKLVQARAGEVDSDWWRGIIKADVTIRGGGCGGYEVDKHVDGWLPSLVLYNNKHNLARLPMDPEDLPSIVGSAPLTMPDDSEWRLLAGSVGFSVDPAVRPVHGWALVRGDTISCREGQ